MAKSKKRLDDEARVHTRRLLKLARILEEHKEPRSRKKGTHFDMNQWFRHDGDHEPSVTEGFCGTVACALGHAAMDKGFQRQGLKLEISFVGGDPENKSYYTGDIIFNDSVNEGAGAAFFGLSDREADDVFLGAHRHKAAVVEVLRQYAKEREELGNGRDEQCSCGCGQYF